MAIFHGIFLDQECVNQVALVLHGSIPCQKMMNGEEHALELASILLLLANPRSGHKEDLILKMVPGLESRKRNLCRSMRKPSRYCGKKDILHLLKTHNLYPVPTTPEISCMMFASAPATYEADFPALERKSNPASQTHTKPFIQPTKVQLDGKLKPLTQAEEVLNWQIENSLAQNHLLTKINQKVDGLMSVVEQRLGILSEKLQKY